MIDAYALVLGSLLMPGGSTGDFAGAARPAWVVVIACGLVAVAPTTAR